MPLIAQAEEWLALSLTPGLGDETLRRLVSAVGGPAQAFASGPGFLKTLLSAEAEHGVRTRVGFAHTAAALEWLTAPDHYLLPFMDPAYPAQLLEIHDPPPLLYVAGNPRLLEQPSLAVVGSRNATPQGQATATQFASHLGDAGLCVVSGLALGIDAAAHQGALDGPSSSIAVVGTGLDRVYPSRNRDLAHRLAREGALISEFPLGTPPRGNHFPRRNRIISGLALGCLVVEAGVESGSLITARLAAEQGREVFAIPGSIHNPVAKGCHALIKQGAKLVESVDDILEELRWRRGAAQAAPPDDPGRAAQPAQLLEALGHEIRSVEALCGATGWPAEQVVAGLLELELAGRVAVLPGGLYQRLEN